MQAAISQANHTRTEHQMWACGSDFQYQNADHWYHNLDKVRVRVRVRVRVGVSVSVR